MSIAHDSYRIASCTTVCPDPKAAQGMLRADCGKQMGGSPKASQQHLVGETSLLGVTRSPTAVARAPVTSRANFTLDIKSGEAVERRQDERSSDRRYIFRTVTSKTTS